MKKVLKILIPVIIIIGIIAAVMILGPSDEVKMNDEYVNGNTAGNLYNGGLFCEHDGTIYFANPSDGGKLYSMDSNGKNLTKLSSDTPAYINVDDNYIYYTRYKEETNLDYSFFAFHTSALCRMDKNGENVEILDTEPSHYAALLGNYIYYIHYDKLNASTLYKVRIDGEEQMQVKKEAVFTCNTDGYYFYYNGMLTDGSIHRYDTRSDSATVVYAGNTYQPIVENGTDAYFIDGDSDYAIVHTDLTDGNPVYVTRDSVDSYNLDGDTIYYQRNDTDGSALCMVKNDGSEPVVIREGVFSSIHVTSHFVFFEDYYTGEFFYFPRNNPQNIKQFSPGTAKD